MAGPPILFRARRSAVWLVVLLGVLAGPLALSAQQPAAGDTIPQDTVLIPIPSDVEPGDTIPDALAAAAESDARVPVVPPFPASWPASWSSARTVLTQAELARLPGLTLLEIVERLPGMVGFRAGSFGRPEALTALGLGGGRLRVIVDGLEMPPIGSAAFELEALPLPDIESVTVERGPGEVRVEVRTFRLDQPDAHSVVELGTGIYQTRLLRGLFSRGFGARAVGTGAFDLVTTRGFGIREPYSHSTALFRYAYAVTPRASLQAEWRRLAIDREGEAFPRQTTRSDLTLRGRAALTDNLVLEAILARITQEEAAELAGEYHATSTHGVLRSSFGSDVLDAEASIRFRGTDEVVPPLPGLDAEGRIALSPATLLRLEAFGRTTSGSGLTTNSGSATGAFTPLAGLSVFGTVAFGERPLPRLERIDEVLRGDALVGDASGWRAGASFGLGDITLGGAAFQGPGGLIAPFGLGFDESLLPVDLEPARYLEGSFAAGVPGTNGAIAVDGWYARSTDPEVRPYSPIDLGQAAILFHGLYYGGQLEPTLRVEGTHRGRSLVPGTDGATFSASTAPYQMLNFSLQLRILDVEAFFLWENLLNSQTGLDLPGVPASYPRIVYGAEWRFRG